MPARSAPRVTERLIVRPPRLSDLEVLAEHRADPEVMRYIGNGAPRDRAEVAEALARTIELAEQRGLGLWTITERESGSIVGDCGLVPICHNGGVRGPEIEIGYRLGRAFWGRGYATEAARAMLAYGTEELALERVLAVTYPQNTASQHVLRKIGMREVGPCREYYDVETVLFESRPTSGR